MAIAPFDRSVRVLDEFKKPLGTADRTCPRYAGGDAKEGTLRMTGVPFALRPGRYILEEGGKASEITIEENGGGAWNFRYDWKPR